MLSGSTFPYSGLLASSCRIPRQSSWATLIGALAGRLAVLGQVDTLVLVLKKAASGRYHCGVELDVRLYLQCSGASLGRSACSPQFASSLRSCRCTKLYPNRCSSHRHSLSFSSPGLDADAKTRSRRLSTLVSTHAKPRGWIVCSRLSHQRSRKVERECCLHMLSTIGDFTPASGGCLIYRLHHPYIGTDLHMNYFPNPMNIRA